MRKNTISIHAPRGGSDEGRFFVMLSAEKISIHAPRGGSDDSSNECPVYYFISIHAPRGGSDRLVNRISRADRLFQSTLPVGGATWKHIQASSSNPISIHAPRGGSDGAPASTASTFSNFNPRSPWGERQSLPSTKDSCVLFQSTLPVGGATGISAE